MQWMLDLRTYGLKVHYNTTSRGHVEWMGKDELLYKNLHFTMAQFRGMVHGMQAEAKRLLVEELLFCGEQVKCPRSHGSSCATTRLTSGQGGAF